MRRRAVDAVVQAGPGDAWPTEPLARHRHLLPQVAQWFVAEWPAWYGPGGAGDAPADVAAFAASEHALPVGIVAFDRCGLPVGIGALKAESIPARRDLSPWAAAGYVVPGLRGRGIGARLLQALLAQARELGFDHVHCGTRSAATLLERAGWRRIDTVAHDGAPLAIFRSP